MFLASPDVRFWIQAAIIAVLAVAAWRYGRGPEWILAGVLVWFNVGDALNHRLFGPWTDYSAINTGHVVIDVAALVVALGVALFANRIYPLWFAAFQLVAVLAHAAREIARGSMALAYLIMYIGPSYFQIVLLAVGIWLHHRRERRHGPYRSWRSSSRRSLARAPANWRSG